MVGLLVVTTKVENISAVVIKESEDNMKLNKNEKIQSWTVVVKTTNGRELSFNDLGLEIYYTVAKPIDETLEATYPCEWTD